MALNVVPMQSVIETTEINSDFDHLLHRVQSGEEYLLFKKSGHNVAALIGESLYEEFRLWYVKKLMREMGEEVSSALEKEGITSEEQLAELMKEDRKAVYKHHYGSKS